jgi:hypothetical protein
MKRETLDRILCPPLAALLLTTAACEPPDDETHYLQPAALAPARQAVPSGSSRRSDFVPLPPDFRPPPRAAQTRVTNDCPAPTVLYVNFDGGQLHHNSTCSEAAQNCSYIITTRAQTITYPAFTGSASDRQQIISLVTRWYAPFNVQVVSSRPADQPYAMAMVGGTADIIGYPRGSNIGGLGPLDCGNMSPDDISFAFSEADNNEILAVAATIAQETAHSFGLGHTDDPTDIMYPQTSRMENGFHDRVMRIYDLGGTSSDCDGTGRQNDVQRLNQNVGPACGDFAPPDVAITAPQTGATVWPGSAVSITASDASGTVAGVGLFLDGNLLASRAVPPFDFSLGDDVPEGQHTLTARAVDGAGNQAESPPVQVTIHNVHLLAHPVAAAAGGNGGDDADGLEGGCAAGAGGTAPGGPGLVLALGMLAIFARDGWRRHRRTRSSASLTPFARRAARPGRGR